MELANQVIFKGQVYQNYKHFFSVYFSDTERFDIEFNLEGHIERMVVKSKNKKDFLRLEILLLVENGTYTHLFDIRYKHPHSPGFSRLQDSKIAGFDGEYKTFNLSLLTKLTQVIEERLSLGWDEYRYFKAGKYYKSKISLPTNTKPQLFVYRKEQKGLGYILLSTLFGSLYHQLNKSIKIEHKVIRPNWV